MILQTIARDLMFPEGPVWTKDGSILVSEIVGGRISRCLADGRRETVAITGGGPNGAALGPDGALYVCNNGGMEHTVVASRGWILPGEQPADYVGGSIQRIDLASGRVSALYTECDGRRLRAPNDLVFDSTGNFWFTDHGKLRPRDRDRGSLYYASADGRSIREVLVPLDGPNGVALSTDGSRLYVVESFVARVWAWDVIGPGELRVRPHARLFGADLMIGLGGYHLMDSMAVDIDDNLCIATLGDHVGITVVAADKSWTRHIALPGPMPTNLCFGGARWDQAFATLSPQGELVSWRWSPMESPTLESESNGSG
jgi:gluconolactonase